MGGRFIVAPPDGSMVDDMASLEKLAARPERALFFGPWSGDSGCVALRALPDPSSSGPGSLDPASACERRGGYPDHGACDLYRHRSAPYEAAGYSVLAHLEDLVGRGIVATDGDPVIGGDVQAYRSLRRTAAGDHAAGIDQTWRLPRRSHIYLTCRRRSPDAANDAPRDKPCHEFITTRLQFCIEITLG